MKSLLYDRPTTCEGDEVVYAGPYVCLEHGCRVVDFSMVSPILEIRIRQVIRDARGGSARGIPAIACLLRVLHEPVPSASEGVPCFKLLRFSRVILTRHLSLQFLARVRSHLSGLLLHGPATRAPGSAPGRGIPLQNEGDQPKRGDTRGSLCAHL